MRGMGNALYENMLPLSVEVDISEEVIKGVDGNDNTLYIHRPK
jgi:hypothetical protein